MILSPGEQQSLRVISGSIAEGEPHLAGMFRIFARLHADDAAPPVEDLIVAALRAGAAAEGGPGGERSWLRRWLRRAARLSAGSSSLQPPSSAQSPSWLQPPSALQSRSASPASPESAGDFPGIGLIRPRPLGGMPPSRRARRDWVHRRRTLTIGQVLAAVAVPIVLLATLLMVILFGVNSSIRCQSGRSATTSASGTAAGSDPRTGGKGSGGTGTARTGTGGTAARSAGGRSTGGAGARSARGTAARNAGAGSGGGSAVAAPDRLTRPTGVISKGGAIGLMPTGCLHSGPAKSGTASP